MKIFIPIKTVSEANQRCHWAVKARRAKEQRRIACLMVAQKAKEIDETACIGICRIAPRLLDEDNLAGALKAIQDGVADGLGINDRKLNVHRSQRQGKPRQYLVELSFWEAK